MKLGDKVKVKSTADWHAGREGYFSHMHGDLAFVLVEPPGNVHNNVFTVSSKDLCPVYRVLFN